MILLFLPSPCTVLSPYLPLKTKNTRRTLAARNNITLYDTADNTLIVSHHLYTTDDYHLYGCKIASEILNVKKHSDKNYIFLLRTVLRILNVWGKLIWGPSIITIINEYDKKHSHQACKMLVNFLNLSQSRPFKFIDTMN